MSKHNHEMGTQAILFRICLCVRFVRLLFLYHMTHSHSCFTIYSAGADVDITPGN